MNSVRDYNAETNDSSKEGSLREISSLKEQDSRIMVITFTRIFGQMAAAFTAGMNPLIFGWLNRSVSHRSI